MDPIAPNPVTLWTIADCAAYLHRSPRWVWECIRKPASDPGSIPHARLPGGSPRFIPADIAAWVADGCPPAALFLKWRRKTTKSP